METRNDRFPCHLGCRQPGVRQKGELVGAGVDGNECSLLITHCRATAAWVLLLASANTKATVTSSLIRKRSPPRPPPAPAERFVGSTTLCLKSLMLREVSWGMDFLSSLSILVQKCASSGSGESQPASTFCFFVYFLFSHPFPHFSHTSLEEELY